MTLDYFKDKLFDVLNDGSSELGIADIESHDRENTLEISTTDGGRFEIRCRELPCGEV